MAIKGMGSYRDATDSIMFEAKHQGKMAQARLTSQTRKAR